MFAKIVYMFYMTIELWVFLGVLLAALVVERQVDRPAD